MLWSLLAKMDMQHHCHHYLHFSPSFSITTHIFFIQTRFASIIKIIRFSFLKRGSKNPPLQTKREERLDISVNVLSKSLRSKKSPLIDFNAVLISVTLTFVFLQAIIFNLGFLFFCSSIDTKNGDIKRRLH